MPSVDIKTLPRLFAMLEGPPVSLLTADLTPAQIVAHISEEILRSFSLVLQAWSSEYARIAGNSAAFPIPPQYICGFAAALYIPLDPAKHQHALKHALSGPVAAYVATRVLARAGVIPRPSAPPIMASAAYHLEEQYSANILSEIRSRLSHPTRYKNTQFSAMYMSISMVLAILPQQETST